MNALIIKERDQRGKAKQSRAFVGECERERRREANNFLSPPPPTHTHTL